MTLRCILAPLASPDTLRGQVTDADWAAAAAFPPRRRAEYLTWRAVVYRELGAVPIGYDAAGGPVLIGDPRHIGVSHGGGHAAVVYFHYIISIFIHQLFLLFVHKILL